MYFFWGDLSLQVINPYSNFWLTEKITAKTTEIAELLGVKNARARRLLGEMVAGGTIVTEGENRNRVYKLKA